MRTPQIAILRCLLITVASALISTASFAQHYNGHNWYFGATPTGIVFNRTDNSPSLVNNQAIPFGNGGSAVASDRLNGNLLFYTDGANIYDASHRVMPNGNITAGSANPSGNQPVAIAKAPGNTNPNRYYVFFNSANGTTAGNITYRLVDLDLAGNSTFPQPFLGEVLPGGNLTLTSMANVSEGMITVPHANGEDFWLIAHGHNQTQIRVLRFTESGPVATTLFNNGGLIEYASNFSYHPNTGRFAVAPYEAQRNVEILNFDNATGIFAGFGTTVLNSGAPAGTATEAAIYDTEWSSSGDFLYVSYPGTTGAADVKQYAFGATTVTLQTVLPAPIARSYGLQMGPDSVMYHLYQQTAGGNFLVGALTNTDTIFSEVNYDPTAFDSNPNFDGKQFPSFAPKDTVGVSVSFTFAGTCANAPTSFYPTVTPPADSLRWTFGDGNSSNAWSPVHTYASAGTFQVILTAFAGGGRGADTLDVTITAFDLQLSLVQDTTACICEYKPPVGSSCAGSPFTVEATAQNGTGASYQWFGPSGLLAGQTSLTLTPDSAGYYYVVGTVGACSTYAGVNIKTYDSLDQRANIWHFGQNAGIDFNGLPNDPPVAITGPLNSPEGTSVISDRNGQVIFSTDGASIFNKLGANITPPDGLGGSNESTQSALIIPVPGDETLFYIFTTQPIYGAGGSQFELRYSLFDLKLNNGVGDLAEYNQLLFGPSTERITSDGNWLIAHEYGNNSFRAYQISQQGIGNPVITAIGSPHLSTVEVQGQGYMEIGTPSRIAVALSTPGVSNVVEIFDFVDSTGVVTNFRTADLGAPAGQVYGLEISSGGNKLFASVKQAPAGPSQIVEFAFDSLGNPFFKNRTTFAGQEIGAMQVGPDGQIYVAINNSAVLGTFQANEDTTQVTALTIPLQPFALVGGTLSKLGLPNFTQIISNPTQTPGFTFAGLCLGDSTIFTASGKDPVIDKFDWTIVTTGESFADHGPELRYLFPAPGTYTVSVRVYNKCEEVGIFTEDVVINDIPADPSAGIALCTDEITVDANPADIPRYTYAWSTGETTEQIVINTQGTFSVTITDSLGCTRDATFLAADNRPIVDLGPNQTICEDASIAPLDAGNPLTMISYRWELNDAANGNTARTQNVDTTVPGTFEYKVTVVDGGTPANCTAVDSITFVINDSPDFMTTATNPTSCVLNNGSIALNITGPATKLFQYSITGPGTPFSGVDQPVGTVNTGNVLGAGTYSIAVTEQVSGCTVIGTQNVNSNAFTVVATPSGNCDNNVQLNVDTAPVPPGALPAGPFTFRVIDQTTGAVVPGAAYSGSDPDGDFPISGLRTGRNYVVEVRNPGSNCTASSAPVGQAPGPTYAVSFSTADICNRNVTAIAAGATSFNWSASPAGSGVQTQTTPTVTVNPGTWTLVATASGPTSCPGTGTVTVNVQTPLTPTLSQSDGCEDQVTLTATPSSGTEYLYRWSVGGAPVAGAGGSQLTVTTSGTYAVQVVNRSNGCPYNSPSTPVNILGAFTASVAPTGPTCESIPFTLQATPTPSVGTFTYIWRRDGALLNSETSSTLSRTDPGFYEVTIQRNGVCQEKATFSVALLPVTQGELTDLGFICPDRQTVTLNAGDGFISYEWLYEGAPITGANGQSYDATEAGLYTVNLVNAFGCPATDNIDLREECDPIITGPNVFRPGSQVSEGGEQVNSFFRLFSFYIDDEDFQVFIFNRWGEMVFESSDREFRWNGGYNNNASQPLPPGTYSYVVKYKSQYRPEEGVKERRGGVALLR